MPHIAGESLRLPLDETARLTRDIAGALAHEHPRSLVRRDIKPEGRDLP